MVPELLGWICRRARRRYPQKQHSVSRSSGRKRPNRCMSPTREPFLFQVLCTQLSLATRLESCRYGAETSFLDEPKSATKSKKKKKKR